MNYPIRRRDSLCLAFTLIELLVVIAIIAILATLTLPVIGRFRDNAYQVQSTANLRAIGMGMSLFLDDNNGQFPGRGSSGRERPPLRLAVYMDSQHGRTFDEVSAATGENFRRMEFGYRVPAFHYPTVPPSTYTAGSSEYISDVVGCYGFNIHLMSGGPNAFWGKHRSSILDPSRTVLAGERYAEDTTSYYINANGPYSAANREGLASNLDIRSKGVPAGAGSATGLSGVLFADMHVQNVRLESLTPYPEREGVNPRMIFVVD